MEKRGSFVLETQAETTNEVYGYILKVPEKQHFLKHMKTINKTTVETGKFSYSTGVIAGIEHYFKIRLTLLPTLQEIIVIFCCQNQHLLRYRVWNITAEFLKDGVVQSSAPFCTIKDGLANTFSELTLREEIWTWKERTSQLWLAGTTEIQFQLTIREDKLGDVQLVSSDQYFAQSNIGASLLDPEKYFLSDELSDITIKCGAEIFPAHKMVLFNRSSVFAKMFGHKMKEELEKVVEIKDVEPKVMKELLRYIYNGVVENVEEITKPLYQTAHKYCVNDLISICENFLVWQTTIENAVEMYKFSELYNAVKLKAKAASVIKDNKDVVMKDTAMFKEFTNEYVEFMFDVFKSK